MKKHEATQALPDDLIWITTDDGEKIQVTRKDYETTLAIAAQRDANSHIDPHQQKFSAIEHKAIGDIAFCQFAAETLLDTLQEHGLFNRNTLELKLNPRLWLTPGLLVALVVILWRAWRANL